jgi:hypothetical protein
MTTCVHAETQESTRAAQSALRRELLDMAAADQAARSVFTEKGVGKIDARDVARIREVDAANRARLKQIIAEQGWPTKQAVGGDGVEAAFLIVQHADADPAFQQEMLPFIEQSFEAGVLSGEDVALLTDRILTNEGKPQRYGTQVEIIDGEAVVKPIADPEKVDELRADLGLPSLEEYMRELKKFYGLQEEKP